MNEPIVTLLCVEQYYNIIARVEPGILWTGASPVLALPLLAQRQCSCQCWHQGTDLHGIHSSHGHAHLLAHSAKLLRHATLQRHGFELTCRPVQST